MKDEALYEDGIPVGNLFNKYESKNPVFNFLLNRFLKAITDFIADTKAERILEVGCGEGYLADYIADFFGDAVTVKASDFSNKIIEKAKGLHKRPNLQFFVQNIYDIKQKDDFDLIIASEVFEHLEYPEQALKQVSNSMSSFFMFSVPNEPIWSISNLFRMKYIRRLGNTPGHVNHWSKKSFKRFLEGELEVFEIKTVFPWIVALCKKR
jgi:2-polyprenyl-3-methyl-5-hydroxy-6-metoxy-1,4-benzoquinol methylase